MAEADWTLLTNSVSAGSVDRGVTTGITPPSGGGSFVFGFNALTASPSPVGFFVNLANFSPMAKGGRITGAIRRAGGGNDLGFSTALFLGLQGADISDEGYFLGLSDGSPHHITLRKGLFNSIIPDDAPDPTVNGVLRRSTITVAPGTYLHLRLDMVVNLNNDVILQVFQNDLVAQPLGTTPVWTAIAGMDDFVDDALAINTGSQPFLNGRGGYGFYSENSNVRAFVDHLEVFRQL